MWWWEKYFALRMLIIIHGFIIYIKEKEMFLVECWLIYLLNDWFHILWMVSLTIQKYNLFLWNLSGPISNYVGLLMVPLTICLFQGVHMSLFLMKDKTRKSVHVGVMAMIWNLLTSGELCCWITSWDVERHIKYFQSGGNTYYFSFIYFLLSKWTYMIRKHKT